MDPNPDLPAAGGPRAPAPGDKGKKKKRWQLRPALLGQFPSFWFGVKKLEDLPDDFDPLFYGNRFPEEYAEHYRTDRGILRRWLIPGFYAMDQESLRAQNEFRRDQVVLIVGGVLATLLGAYQGVEPDKVWKIAAAVWSGGLAAWATRARDLGAQERWRTSRLKAELLRGEYFLFLGRVPPYDDAGCRERELIRRVAAIRSGAMMSAAPSGEGDEHG